LTARQRLAAIVTTGNRVELEAMAVECAEAARSGLAVRVFFRDESIPEICNRDTAARLRPEPAMAWYHPAAGDPTKWDLGARVSASLRVLVDSGDVRLYACSSSLYIWGVEASALLPTISGARGLIAFLAEDLAGAEEVLSYSPRPFTFL
jgi:peroxiredoxin family protein